MEKILDFQSRNEDIIGVLVYEDFEDFSIYLKDQMGQISSSMTYQVKFKKSTVPSDYYPEVVNQNVTPQLSNFH